MSLDGLDANANTTKTKVVVAAFSNGAISTIISNADINARLVEYDREGDGKIDNISFFYEDDEGKTLKGKYDADMDGKIDSISLFEYDDDGNIKARYDDVNADYIFDSYIEFSYDKDGNRIASKPKEITGWSAVSKMTQSLSIDASILSKMKQLMEEQRQKLD